MSAWFGFGKRFFGGEVVVVLPITPVVVEGDAPPVGGLWQEAHCAVCARWQASLGLVPESAWLVAHGTDDEKFGATLGAG